MNILLLFSLIIIIVFIGWIFLNNQKGNLDCKVTGCSGQICSDINVPTTCEYKCEYSCYKKANCKKINGRCGWETGPEFYKCLDDCNRNK